MQATTRGKGKLPLCPYKCGLQFAKNLKNNKGHDNQSTFHPMASCAILA